MSNSYILDTLVLPEVSNNIADLEKVLSGGSQPSFSHSPSVSAADAHSPFLKSSHMLSGLFSEQAPSHWRFYAQWLPTRQILIWQWFPVPPGEKAASGRSSCLMEWGVSVHDSLLFRPDLRSHLFLGLQARRTSEQRVTTENSAFSG